MGARSGFTLLEVALAVTVGLLVTAGVLLSYESRKESAGNSIARERMTSALGTIETFTSTSGRLPVSGSLEFAKAWAALHPEEKGQSPWGGPTGDTTLGVSEDPPLATGSLVPATAPDVTSSLTVDGTRQSNLYFVSLANTAGYVRVASTNDPVPALQHSYVLSVYDHRGTPWLWVAGGK